jgi:S-disulfanyl-L-cysteine oxidoreductase SoxD
MPNRLIRICVVVAAVIAAGCDPPWHHEMREQPSLSSTHSPREPAPGALPMDGEARMDRTAGEALRNPLGPDAAVRGRLLYGVYCAPCHGISGTGDGPVPAHFALGTKAPPADLTSDKVQQHSDGWIYGTIVNGTALMAPYRYELSPRDRWAIVTFVRQMRSSGR